ncbi:hypothetical protein FGK64_20265 [Arenibacterium halophilum]|uniref:Uncharacterized protein n=1 Tax=Arenibacterium halophilum TaxID=2583821 RepID=A0ABY2WZC9_9RHOB|nr:hypothetical protein FGK64_20265 [Arenibacterium halophilum]
MHKPLLADSVTKLDGAQGRVVVTGSHGGVYAACLAFRSGCRAAVFHDAGVGLDDAGIGGLGWLDAPGMAAVAVDHRSAPIGDAAEMLARGIVSHINAAARAAGAQPGMSCAEAVRHLEGAAMATGDAPEIREAREDVAQGARRLVLVDSASLVRAEDAGQIVVTGSHGAVFGGNPANALKADAYLALFNDAGGAATSRLSALQDRGVAAATVAAMSARIGDARSTWEDGVISACNDLASTLGGRPGMTARELVARA